MQQVREKYKSDVNSMIVGIVLTVMNVKIYTQSLNNNQRRLEEVTEQVLPKDMEEKDVLKRVEKYLNLGDRRL